MDEQTTAHEQAHERAAQCMIEGRLRAMTAIPWDACPWPAARNELFARILSGAPIDVSARYDPTAWLVIDRTYPDAPVSCTLRAWAARNGYAVDDDALATDDGKEGVPHNGDTATTD